MGGPSRASTLIRILAASAGGAWISTSALVIIATYFGLTQDQFWDLEVFDLLAEAGLDSVTWVWETPTDVHFLGRWHEDKAREGKEQESFARDLVVICVKSEEVSLLS